MPSVWTSPPTWAVSAILHAAELNTYVRDNELWLHDAIVALQTPADHAVVFNSSSISLADGIFTALTMNSEVVDSNTIHDPATNPSRLTCKTAGMYAIFGLAEFDANAVNDRRLEIWKNGSANPIAHDFAPKGGALSGSKTVVLSVFTVRDLALTDYVELAARQNSGGALSVLAINYYSPYFGMVRLAPV